MAPAESRKPETASQIRPKRGLVLDSDLWLSVRLTMVGLGRLELPTSRLSGVRSNHLSYRPECLCFRVLPEERET